MTYLTHPIRALLTWNMIPLVFLSGLPLAVCVCASGEQRLFCRGVHSLSAAESDNPACCRKTTEVLQSSPRHSCCATRIAVPETNGASMSSRCCQSVTTLPNPTVSSPRFSLPDDQLPTDLLPPPSQTLGPANSNATEIVALVTAIPPLDLVILHQVLTI